MIDFMSARRLLVGLATAAACFSGAVASAQADILDDLQAAGVANAALAKGPPISDLTADGKPTGYTPTVAAKILATLGVKEMNGVLSDFKGFIPGLEARRWDLVTAGMDITSARCKVILFSEPLTVQRETFTVVKGNPKGITSHESFVTDSGLKFAAIAGSSQEAYAKNEMKVPAEQIVPVPDHRTGIDAVLSGRADAMALGEFSVKRVTNDDDRQKLETFPLSYVPVTGTAVAFRKADKAFRDKFDEELTRMRSSGELGKLYEEWGFTNPDDLRDVKRADLAEGCE